MREILFRGKRLGIGEWTEGNLLTSAAYHDRAWITESKTFFDRQLGGIAFVEVTPDTVGQYTGLTDKNGAMVFEGDILASRYDENHPEDITIEVVTWTENGWCIKAQEDDPFHLYESGTLPFSEIIGNIHDKSELLEGTK